MLFFAGILAVSKAGEEKKKKDQKKLGQRRRDELGRRVNVVEREEGTR